MSEKKEYIERGALSKFVRDVRKRLPKDSKDFFTRDEMLLNFQQYVDAQPAADVEPVVRGWWMWKTTKEAEAFAPLGIVLGTENYICSECKKYLHRESMRNPLPKYCDECGAKMGLPGKERER